MSGLTVVLSHKDRNHNLNFCLASINESDYTPRVILVDFGSKEKLEYSYPWLKVVYVVNKTDFFHKARAINIGIKQVKTKNLCVTDVDQIFKKNFFSVVNNVLNTQKDIYVMCRTYALRELPNDVTPENVMEKHDSLLQEAKNILKAPFGDGCCQGMPTKIAMSLCGYDERMWGWGYEDTDMTWRAHAQGLNHLSINSKTSMIHLPHTIDKNKGGYRWLNYRDANKKLHYQNKRARTRIVNKNVDWGKI